MAGNIWITKIGSIYNKNIQFVNSGYKNMTNFYGYSGDTASGLTYVYPYSGLIVHSASGMSMPNSGNIYLASLNASNQNFSGTNYVSGMSKYGVNTFYSSVTYSGSIGYTSTIGVYAPSKAGAGTIAYNCALYAENTSNDGIINVAIYANGSTELRSCNDARPTLKVAGYSATQSAGLINFYRDASGDIVSVVDCSGTYNTSGNVKASGFVSGATVYGAKIQVTSAGNLKASTSSGGMTGEWVLTDSSMSNVTLTFNDGLLVLVTGA